MTSRFFIAALAIVSLAGEVVGAAQQEGIGSRR